MSPRTRIWTIVAAVCAVAVALTVGVVALTRDEPRAAAAEPPPLFLDLGVRTDPEAVDLRRAADLYAEGRRDEAAELFARHDSLEARVGAALAAWPDSLERLERLPRDRAAVRLHLGLALASLGDERAAREQLGAAAGLDADTAYAVRADDFLHPRFIPGLPIFVPEAPFPRTLADRPPPEQLEALERDPTLAGRLHHGAALQRLLRPVSARRAFDEAAAGAPDDPEALTAAAVGRFDKSDPSLAFSRLGPLAQRFPEAQSPRFHLGLLLLWIGDVAGAREQLERARDLGPETRLGREAQRFLDRL